MRKKLLTFLVSLSVTFMTILIAFTLIVAAVIVSTLFVERM